MPTLTELPSLSPPQRAIVEALAVACDELPLTNLATALDALGHRQGTRKHSTRSVGVLIDELEARGWVQRTSRVGLDEALTEPITRLLLRSGRYEQVGAAVDVAEPLRRDYWTVRPGTVKRERRRAFVAGDIERLDELTSGPYGRIPLNLMEWLTNPLQRDMMLGLPATLAGWSIDIVSCTSFANELRVDGLTELAVELAHKHERSIALWAIAARQCLLSDDIAQAESLCARLPDDTRHSVRAWLAFAKGDVGEATKLYAKALATERKYRGTNKVLLPGPEGVLVPLVYALEGSKSRIKQAATLVDLGWDARRFYGPSPYDGYDHLRCLLDPTLQRNPEDATHPMAKLLEALVATWLDREVRGVEAATQRAESLGWKWIANELRCLSGAPIDRGAVPLVSHRKATAEWEVRLDAIELALGTSSKTRGKGKKKRLAWFVGKEPFEIEVREQTSQGKDWSSGRRVALGRFVGQGKAPKMTEADQRIAACLQVRTHRSWRGYPETTYSWDEPKAWAALAGHPAVFDRWGEPLTIVALQPRLIVQENAEGGAWIEVRPRPGQDGVHIERVGPAGYEVTAFDKKQRSLADLIGAGLHVPADGKQRLDELVSSMEGCFEMAEGGRHVDERAGDPTPTVLLRPNGGGLQVSLVVQPLGPQGPNLRPGRGAEMLLGRIDGDPVRAKRDLDAELDAILDLEEACPLLVGAAATDELLVDDPQEALELVAALHSLGDGVRVLWPEGESLKLRANISSADMRMSVQSAADWFRASGSLVVDETLALELAELLRLVAQQPGRFLHLDDGSFLALTERFRQQLDAVSRIAKRSGDSVEVHRLLGETLAPLVDDAGEQDWDEGWDETLIELANPGADAEVPTELSAELRPYQLDGFRWLTRLAKIRAGACLADDMGLGKTIMALAVLLQRAPQGPALVVAPTSVCGNWMREAWRFASPLNTIDFAASERSAVLDELTSRDVVIVSYGILANEIDRLATVRWSTIILDEAHAIKNPRTQRHKAARRLNGDFRMALTGTPIENHLGELWALFSFLNPGMLGSEVSFRSSFTQPIANGERAVQQQLRRLVAPFILRRTKSAVLDELPARTEIDMPVELSHEEAALYEAIRVQALEALDEEEPGQVQVLAQLTQLRLAACHPRLVLPDATAPSSKLEAFGELVEGLMGGNHRALVFSQFVRHLSLLRAWLDERGIEYQYLDGQTPRKARDERVEAFQNGEGKLFLISLKAGGTGLNLTAADYVIHMDPWWNPAVEDQASDRAHRLGQTRPVTIYRLIARGTVEERIVDLHRQKRDLADQVLAGADSAARLSARELVALIRDSVSA